MVSSTSKVLFCLASIAFSLNATAQVYNESTRQLTLPNVQVGNLSYPNVVIRLDNYTVLAAGLSVPVTASALAAPQIQIYNETTRQLTLPNVQVGNVSFPNVVIRLNNFAVLAAGAATAVVAKALTLSQPPDRFFGRNETVLSMPFSTSASESASVSCVGSGCTTVYDVATFKLSASGQSFTISNLQAINQTSGSAINPLFSGLASGQVITAGQNVTFKLQSPFTLGRTVSLRYTFTVLETGQTFDYTVQLQTNS